MRSDMRQVGTASSSDRILFGTSCALSAAALFAVMSYCTHLSAHPSGANGTIAASTLLLARSVVAILALTPLVYHELPILLRREGRMIWSRSFFGAISALCLFNNLQSSSVGDASVLTQLSPLLIAALSYRWFKESLTKVQLLGIGIVLVGVTTASLSKYSLMTPKVVALGIAGATFTSLAYVSLRQAAKSFSPFLIVWAFSVAGLVICSLYPGTFHFAGFVTEWPIVATVSILGLIGQLALTWAFISLPGAIAGALVQTSLLFGVALEVTFSGRIIDSRLWLSYISVVVGLVILNLARNRTAILPHLPQAATDIRDKTTGEANSESVLSC